MKRYFASLLAFIVLVSYVALGSGLNYITPLKNANWKPNDETGLLFGYESFNPTFQITQASNLVSAWADIGPNGYNAAQSNGSFQPTYESNTGPNSVPVVFLNNKTLLVNNNNAIQLLSRTRGHSLYAVAKFNAFNGGANIIACFLDTVANSRPCFQYKNSTNRFEFSGPNTGSPGYASTDYAQSTNTTNWHKMLWTYNGSGVGTTSNFNFYYDGGSATTVGSVAAGGGTNSVIGNYLNGSDATWSANARVVAIYLWDHEISSTVRAKMDAYLSANLGL